MPRVKNIEIALSRSESPNWVSVSPEGPPVNVGSWSGESVEEERTNEVNYCVCCSIENARYMFGRVLKVKMGQVKKHLMRCSTNGSLPERLLKMSTTAILSE